MAERVVRVIAGSAKGRRLEVPRSGTRPLTGKAREAVFSSLAAEIPEADVLDLFAGSGSLGLEALSRGARSCVFVERDRRVGELLARNVAAVGLGGSIVVAPVAAFLARERGRYDLVFVDPPYATADADVAATLDLAAERLGPEGVVVVHRRIGADLGRLEKLIVRDERRYGDARIWVLEKEDA